MLGKVLRIVGIVLLALTSVAVLLGGIGTFCVAFKPTGYGPIFAPIARFQWLYILYVVTGVLFGVMGILATIALIKGKSNGYRQAITMLVLSLVVGIIHIISSRALRGSSQPADMIVYVNALTLLVFLLFRIPGIWNQIGFTKRDDHTTGFGTGVAMIVVGVITLTVQIWAGPTHMLDGINYADVWHLPLAIVGWALTLGGGIILGRYVLAEPELDEVVAPVAIGK